MGIVQINNRVIAYGDVERCLFSMYVFPWPCHMIPFQTCTVSTHSQGVSTVGRPYYRDMCLVIVRAFERSFLDVLAG